MELFVLLRYILLSALVTTILIRIFYYLKNQLNHKKIIKQILTSIVFALGLFIVMYSVYSEDNKHNFYDTRMIYLTFIAITYQPFSIILTIILAITTVSFYLTGVELLIFIVSLFIPLIVVYGCRYLIKKKDILEFNFYENILLLLLINILFLIPIHFMVGLNLNLIITKLLFNPFIFSLIIFVNKKLNTYYSLSESYSYKNKMINEALESTKEFEIYILDTSYNYVYFNLYHQEQMAYFNKAIIQIGDNFIENVLHIDVRNRLRENIDLALNGQKIAKRLLVEDKNGTYLEEHYVPVYNKKQQITYITVFSHNVTNQVNYEKQINFLSYYDGLTKLLNRRSLNKNIS